jgi:anti-anti-sigma factor
MRRHRHRLSCQVEEAPDAVVVRLDGTGLELTYAESDDLETLLGPIADRAGGRKLLLDFGNVVRVSAAVLGTLVQLHRTVRAAGGVLAIRNLDALVYDEFEVTRLTTVFEVRRKDAAPGRCPTTSASRQEVRS